MELKSDIDRISKVIEDYGQGVFGKLGVDHVRKWLNQFENNHDVIAYETANILEKYYVTEKNMRDFSKIVIDRIREKFNDDFTIIETQGQKKSQTLIVDFIKKNGLSSEFFDTEEPKKNIIYLDDFVFSGNTLQSDLRTWLGGNLNVRNSIVRILTIGKYNYEANRQVKYLEGLFKERKIEFTIESLKTFCFSDNFQLNSNSLSNKIVDMYICNNLGGARVPPRVRGGYLITDRTNREIYETEMAKAGIKIINFCREPNKVMKPLGYSYVGLGFGGALFSYRNCPNTAPLAFWWGDPNPSNNDDNHPFRKWFPLMQRIY